MYRYINNKVDLVGIIPKIESSIEIGLDIEASSLDIFSCKLLLLQLEIDGEIFIINCVDSDEETLKHIISILHYKSISNKCVIIGHNIVYDIKVIYRIFGYLLYNLYDTMLGEILTKAGLIGKFPSLEELVEEKFNVKLDKGIRESFYNKTDGNFTEQQILYSALDVKYLKEIKALQEQKLSEQSQLHIADLEMSLIPVVAMMEYTGINLDKELWISNIKLAEENVKRLREDILNYIQYHIDFSKYKTALDLCDAFKILPKSKRKKEIIDELSSIKPEYAWDWFINNFNLNSPAQVLSMLNLFGVKVKDTNAKTLKPHINNKLVGLLDDYRGEEKIVDAYGEKFLAKINPVTKKIHTRFNQLGTATGRLSSDDPNLQNIPRDSNFRHAFIAPQGYYIVKIDYSQAELRLMAEISKEKEMIKAFNNEEDLHARSATAVYKISIENVTSEQRQRGKNLNFGLIYGISEYGLYYTFGIPIEEGRTMLEEYFKFYSKLNVFIKKAGDIILDRKYSITPLGRKRFFKDVKLFDSSSDMYKYVGRLRREGVNHIIQGGIADVVKIAMRNIFYGNPFGDDVKILLQVHDELVFLVKEEVIDDAVIFLKDAMIKAGELFIKQVPVKVDCSVERFWKK